MPTPFSLKNVISKIVNVTFIRHRTKLEDRIKKPNYQIIENQMTEKSCGPNYQILGRQMNEILKYFFFHTIFQTIL